MSALFLFASWSILGPRPSFSFSRSTRTCTTTTWCHAISRRVKQRSRSPFSPSLEGSNSATQVSCLKCVIFLRLSLNECTPGMDITHSLHLFFGGGTNSADADVPAASKKASIFVSHGWKFQALIGWDSISSPTSSAFRWRWWLGRRLLLSKFNYRRNRQGV